MEIVDGQVRHRASHWLGTLTTALLDEAACAVADAVGVVVHMDGDGVTASTATVARCDAVQDAAGEGPRGLALSEDHDVVVDDVGTCGRWPAWVAACREAGAASAAVVVGRHDEARVALSVYRASAGAWPTGTTAALRRVADALTVLTLASREVEAVTRATEDSIAALQARAVIDQALGVVMAQNRCDSDAAFEILRTASMRRNAKLRTVASDIVTSVSGRPPRVAAFQPRSAPSGRGAGAGPSRT